MKNEYVYTILAVLSIKYFIIVINPGNGSLLKRLKIKEPTILSNGLLIILFIFLLEYLNLVDINGVAFFLPVLLLSKTHNLILNESYGALIIVIDIAVLALILFPPYGTIIMLLIFLYIVRVDTQLEKMGKDKKGTWIKMGQVKK